VQTFGFYNDTAPPVQSDYNPFGFIATGGFPPATLVQFKQVHTYSSPIQLDSPITQGNFLIAILMRGNVFGGQGFTDNLGNVWTQFNIVTSLGLSSRMVGYYCYNCIGGTEIITSTTSGVQTWFIAEYSGILSTSNPLITSAVNSGGNNPLINTLNYSNDAMIFSCWYNSVNNSQTGIYQNALTYINQDIAQVDRFNSQMHSLKKSADLSPLTIGVNTNGSDVNLLITGVFKLGI
jgi:hypothetical protein